MCSHILLVLSYTLIAGLTYAIKGRRRIREKPQMQHGINKYNALVFIMETFTDYIDYRSCEGKREAGERNCNLK